MDRRRSLFPLAGLVTCAALGIGASGLLGAGPAAATAKPTKITVTVNDATFKLSKTGVSAGTTVIFTVKNTGKLSHTFKIGSRATPRIGPGTRATVTVTFAKKGTTSYSSTINRAAKLKGTFRITAAVKPTITVVPTSTSPGVKAPGPGGTVQVNMFDYGYTFNPTKIPSGDVTFVMTNTGTLSHNLDIKGTTTGVGAYVNPGQSASMTVNLAAGQTYTFLCDVPGHAAAGMQGTFVPNF